MKTRSMDQWCSMDRGTQHLSIASTCISTSFWKKKRIIKKIWLEELMHFYNDSIATNLSLQHDYQFHFIFKFFILIILLIFSPWLAQVNLYLEFMRIPSLRGDHLMRCVWTLHRGRINGRNLVYFKMYQVPFFWSSYSVWNINATKVSNWNVLLTWFRISR